MRKSKKFLTKLLKSISGSRELWLKALYRTLTKAGLSSVQGFSLRDIQQLEIQPMQNQWQTLIRSLKPN